MNRSTAFPPASLWRRAVPLAVAAALLCAVGVRSLRADDITRLLQEELRKRNLYFGDVDGRNSAQLSAALHRYQERKGFSSTGEADANTLFSLNILRPGQPPPARPDPAADLHATNSPPASTPPPLDARDGGPSWPDVTVLRSDEARPTPPPGETEAAAARAEQRLAGEQHAAASPTPAPPPAASGMIRQPTVEEVREYLTHYLQAGQTNDPETEGRYYGDRVAFYDEGNVDHAYVLRDINRYDRRWPDRRFALLDPVTVSPAPNGDRDKFVVNFRLGFNVKNARYAVSGKTDNTWVVSGHEPADWKVIAIKEQRGEGEITERMKDETRRKAEGTEAISKFASIFPPSSFILHPSSFPPR